MFVVEILIGMFFGGVIGGGARIFIKEGGSFSPAGSVQRDSVEKAGREGLRQGLSITFHNPGDLKLR